MANRLVIDSSDLERAVASLEERAEKPELSSEIFVDANLLEFLNKKKNQAIYGRRGMGKTHLLGRLKEYYQDTFEQNRILPVFIDARTITQKFPTEKHNPGISILIIYRRLIEEILVEIERFVDEAISLNLFERFWPGGEKKNKIKTVKEILERLRKTIQRGEVEVGEGIATSEYNNQNSSAKTRQIGADLKLASDLRNYANANAEFAMNLSKVSSSSAEESMKVIYEGIAVLNFKTIGQDVDSLIEILKPEAVAILLDEWSAIDLDHQPLLAEMIKSTIVSGRRVFVKIACISFLTKLGTYTASDQTIGFPLGEEIFLDVDLDRTYNAYVDPESMMVFWHGCYKST